MKKKSIIIGAIVTGVCAVAAGTALIVKKMKKTADAENATEETEEGPKPASWERPRGAHGKFMKKTEATQAQA